VSLAIDLLLAAGLIVLAWQSTIGGSLFRGIVMYIVFGLTMALAWARLGSPDIAMAEAAIGAGVTGALIMIAYWRLQRIEPREPAPPTPMRSRIALAVALLSGALVAMIGLAAVRAIDPSWDLGGELAGEPGSAWGRQAGGKAGYALAEALPATGLGNPITGVLVIFRNLDTLLEIAVLLAAYTAARATMSDPRDALRLPPTQGSPLVGALVAVLAPLTVLVAIYLLKAGSQVPGGAFQAGAVLAACGVLLTLSGRLRGTPAAGAVTRAALVIGTVVFAGLGAAMMAFGEPVLAITGTWAVYLIETTMMISIAATLTLLFAGSAGLAPPDGPGVGGSAGAGTGGARP